MSPFLFSFALANVVTPAAMQAEAAATRDTLARGRGAFMHKVSACGTLVASFSLRRKRWNGSGRKVGKEEAQRSLAS